MTNDIFGPMIYAYTRRQAIDDGALVQISGPGYEGDDGPPAMCRELGYTVPIAMTATAFTRYVCPIEGEGEELAEGQDAEGRLWDVLWMLRMAVKLGGGRREVTYDLSVVPNVPAGARAKRHPRPKRVRLKSVCGPDDDGSPCITIMLPEED